MYGKVGSFGQKILNIVKQSMVDSRWTIAPPFRPWSMVHGLWTKQPPQLTNYYEKNHTPGIVMLCCQLWLLPKRGD
jgi:hypothetical protein